MPRTLLSATFAILLPAIGASAQTAPAAAFEVASIRQSHPSPGRGLAGLVEDITTTPGNLVMRNVKLDTAIRWAYKLNVYELTGPDWISKTRYDIIAKAGTAASEGELRFMLQGLLAERFQLKFHRQMKELSGYALVAGKNANKLHEVTEGGGEGSMVGAALVFEGHRMPMSRLADILSGVLRTPVLDKTRLEGHYDFKLDMRPYITPTQPGDPPLDLLSVAITAVQSELGLKMEGYKAKLEVLVVDSAESVPAEN